jgi:hypothetical protein
MKLLDAFSDDASTYAGELKVLIRRAKSLLVSKVHPILAKIN